MKKRKIWLFLSIGLAIFFALRAIDIPSPTGGAIVEEYLEPEQQENTKAWRLHDHAITFFGVEDIVFPQGVCMPTAHELYGNVAYVPVDVTVGYSTSGIERTSTMSFVINRHERYGTIDFVKSPTFLSEHEADSLISISSEAIVRVPKATRTTYLVMDLYGKNVGPFMYITRGRFSTPSTDCIFLLANGYAICDCDVHTIKGIAVGGLTSPPPVEERYLELIKATQKRINATEAAKEGEVIVSKANGVP